MKKTLFLTTLILSIALVACKQNNDASDGLASFNKDNLKQHIKVLASDEFMGRKPFSIGETKSVEYIKNNFEKIGLEPGNGNSFLQEVPLVEITPNADAVMKVASLKENFELKKTEDFVISTEKTDTIISLNNDELVFAGYGVVAPEYNWNDYEGLDVKGKVVLVMVNDPGFGTADTTLFKGNTMTYYGRWTYKYEEAARQGAKACLIIHNTKAASYPFSVVQNSWGTSNLFLDNRDRDKTLPFSELSIQGWVSGDAAKRLLTAAGKDTTLLASANVRGFKAVPLDLKLSLNVRVKADYNMSHNVVAKITGSKRPYEYVIYTAHWDHLGVGKKDAKGDSIYNGAIDNASGSAALLEIAKAFKSLKQKPERTVIFLSVTAEEQGLLGSAYYTHHPIYPLNKTAANLNMDGINAFGKTNDIMIVGQGQNEIEDYVADVAKTQGRYISKEEHLEAGHYYRSDHFNFAKVGVPALDCSGGTNFIGQDKGYGEKLRDDYVANHYHKPADEFDASWTFDGGIMDIQMLFLVGKKIANETTFPKWKNGSEFKAIRDDK